MSRYKSITFGIGIGNVVHNITFRVHTGSRVFILDSGIAGLYWRYEPTTEFHIVVADPPKL